MGSEQSTLRQNGYTVEQETAAFAVATKGDDKFYIKKFQKTATKESVMEILKNISHPHIISCKNSFTDEDTIYLVMDHCVGGSIPINGTMSQPQKESEALSQFVDICIALKTIHGKGLIQTPLTPKDIFFTKYGVVCLSEPGDIHEWSSIGRIKQKPGNKKYLAPEIFTKSSYNATSDIWSAGCILYELCTQRPAFSAGSGSRVKQNVRVPSLLETFSPEIRELLSNIFEEEPESRPTADEILECPFVINCLSGKCKTTVNEVQTKLYHLYKLADQLEQLHQSTTVGKRGSILAPFTLGTSLIVTGVGIGVGTAGGVTAGVSNITSVVKKSADRKAVQNCIDEIEQKINIVVTWLQEISHGLERISTEYATKSQNDIGFTRLSARAARGLGGIAELIRLARVINIGRIAAQASRAVRVVEAATGVLAGLFLAVDIFFIAMDAKEIHHIRQARAAQATGTPEKQQSSNYIRSEIMKFVHSVRQAVPELQEVLNELNRIISSLPTLHNEP
ncbi:uncharacterized protein V6R79_003495 [Siganus canaliculatus]